MGQIIGQCNVPFFTTIVAAAAVASLSLSGVSLVAYWFMSGTIRRLGQHFPFRAAECRILNGLVWIYLIAQLYFIFSITVQVGAGRPFCNHQWDGWTYYLSWFDWVLVLLLVIWPAICQIVLLYTINQSADDIRLGRPQRKPAWLPIAFRRSESNEVLDRLETIRAEVQDDSTVDRETLLGKIDEIRDATIRETRVTMEEVKQEVSNGVEEMKETIEQATEELGEENK